MPSFLFAPPPQTMGENAPSQLILYHYPELKDSKGLVLMTAEMDPKFIVSLATLYLTFTWQQVMCFGVETIQDAGRSSCLWWRFS